MAGKLIFFNNKLREKRRSYIIAVVETGIVVVCLRLLLKSPHKRLIHRNVSLESLHFHHVLEFRPLWPLWMQLKVSFGQQPKVS